VTLYPKTFEGRLTASGTAYDPADFVVSHPSLPLGSVVLLTHPGTGHSTFARVIDRGPVDDALLMDVSAAVAQELGIQGATSAPIELRIPQ
jgi:rare lipoprotein A